MIFTIRIAFSGKFVFVLFFYSEKKEYWDVKEKLYMQSNMIQRFCKPKYDGVFSDNSS